MTTRHLLAPLIVIVGSVLSLSVGAYALDSLKVLNVLTGEAVGDQFGIAVAGGGDINHDGFPDLLVGANANDAGGSAAGKAYIYFGGPSLGTTPGWSCLGKSGDFLGSSVAIIGDVNGDGFNDFIVGSPFNADLGIQTGKATLFLGGNPPDTIHDLVLYGEAALDMFGAAVAGIGDINGDGYADWAVGAFKAAAGTGKVYIYFGGPTLHSTPDLVILGKTIGERFGCSISKVGRFDGGAYGSFVVGAYSYDDPLKLNVGRSYVFRGGNPPDTVADWVMTGENQLDLFGYSVSGIGDVNGDGYDDILIGAKGYTYNGINDAGKVYVYLGGAAPDTTFDFSVAANQTNADEFGFAVSGAGNLNADSRQEFLVGADLDKSAGTDAGRAYLYLGKTPPPFPRDTLLNPAGSSSMFGSTLAGLGKITNGLYGAFAVGAPGYSSSTGRVYVYGSVDTTHTGTCNCPNQGDINGDLSIDVFDVVRVIGIAFSGDPDPQDPQCPTTRGDVNHDHGTDVFDVIYLIATAFSGGPNPVNPCGP